MNVWHDIELGPKAPEIFPCIIEVPQGSKNKYEIDKKTGLLKLDRVLFSSVHYPENYGFIPQTYCDDQDPLDVLVLGQEPILPLTLVMVKPIGVMKMIDQGEADDKIIAVSIGDPEYSHYNSFTELSPHKIKEIQNFFMIYKSLEKKTVEIKDFLDREQALQTVKESMDLYRTEILPSLNLT